MYNAITKLILPFAPPPPIPSSPLLNKPDVTKINTHVYCSGKLEAKFLKIFKKTHTILGGIFSLDR